MLRDAMHRFPKAEWFCWIDADAWINPREFHVPLTKYVEGVPSDRAAVLANYRGFNTGVLLARGGAKGLDLIRRWLAVSRAGLAQCHPHDQAALAWLQLWRMNGSSTDAAALRPYDFECTKKKACGVKGGFFSCIPLWHAAIRRAHEWDAPKFSEYANQKWVVDEVVDRGFANAETPGFWVAAENERRPRLQCFRCGTSLETIDRFPGKNFFPPHGNGGWLINHKGQGLFYREGMRMSDEADDACFVAAHVRSHYAAR
mmetsp:Transcript_24348/g.73309  ORF Transcript_24348/g.73309 Transcript_24348/m.73309 type:complete len:258 (+) Transcript_24348:757-1530(+)